MDTDPAVTRFAIAYLERHVRFCNLCVLTGVRLVNCKQAHAHEDTPVRP